MVNNRTNNGFIKKGRRTFVEMRKNMINYEEKLKKFWGKEVVRGNLIWPNENVIRFVKQNIKDKQNVILDFGCGAGRNTIALAKEGYNIIGMDYSAEAIEISEKKAKNEKLNIKFVVNQENKIPLPNESVDAVIANGSMFYNTLEDTINLLKNINCVLKNEGMFWADWRSTKDSLYGMGEEIEENFYLLNEESRRGGCTYYFFDKEKLINTYNEAGFNIIAIDTYEYTQNNGKNLSSWFIVNARKM